MQQEYNYITKLFPTIDHNPIIDPMIYWYEGVLRGITQQDLEYVKYLNNSGGISGITLLN
jgi:hypothetical protein